MTDLRSRWPTLDAIRQAHDRIRPHIHRTPILQSRSLSAMAGADLFFKCENLQRCGAFKARGACHAVLQLSEASAKRGVVTHSSGNHAAALAYAGKLRGLHVRIVMPRNAPSVKQAAVRHYGGDITFCEPTVADREAVTQRLIAETGATLVHPFNHPHIIAGQATAACELLDDAGELDVILAPVGGGGLLSGTLLAAKNLHPAVRVYGCEPAWADDAYRSLRAGSIQPVLRTDTIADGLRTSLGDLTFSIVQHYADDVILVEEEEIIAAMRLLFERMKLVVEPSGAVPLAAALSGRVPDLAGRRVGVILSGGNVDVARLPFSAAAG